MQLKEIYNAHFLQNLAQTILLFDVVFDAKKFCKISDDFKNQELKQRMRAITLALDLSLSDANYRDKIVVLKKTILALKKDKYSGLALIIFCDFVEQFGADDFDFSLEVLEFFTEFATAEFAVRRFIQQDSKRALKFFSQWSKSKNHHVRRLASEGLRPRLPWGQALPNFKKDPTDILAILENLKNDDSEYVRRSVANNLNDISKDHPQLVLLLLTRWHREEVKASIIKHALRTLLKKGDKTALQLIGIDCNNLSEKFLIENFSLQKTAVEISQNLNFGFSLCNQASGEKIRLEYAVYFLKKNGTHTKKIFQITTKNFAEGVFVFDKKHSFRDMTTRKHHAGKHMISLVANGIELQKLQFDLI